MSQVTQLETQLKTAKELVRRRQMALALSNVPAFKELIIDDFMTKEAARYVQSSADPALKPDERADALAMAQASGHLKRYLSVIVQMGAHSERELPALEQAIDEARAEEGGE
jgi:cation transport regulator ChaC